MSKISLKHSGGNVVSLNSPTSAPTSADVAFKLPNADGTSGQVLKTDGSGNLSFGADTGGKILQIVQGYKKDHFSSASNDVEITGLNVTITQTASNSKLLISSSIHYGVSGRSLIGFTLYDGSTEITAANSTAGTTDNYFMVQHVHTSSTTNQTYSVFNVTNTFLYDGFGDTNAHTIKVYADTNDSSTFYIGRRAYSDDYSAPSSITVMEVAA